MKKTNKYLWLLVFMYLIQRVYYRVDIILISLKVKFSYGLISLQKMTLVSSREPVEVIFLRVLSFIMIKDLVLAEVTKGIGRCTSLKSIYWLILLLWAISDNPPDRSNHHKVHKSNVVNYTISTIAWIWLNIDTINKFIHDGNILK